MIKFLIDPEYNVKHPERTAGNAGIDFFIPEHTEAFEQAFANKNAIEDAEISSLDGVEYYIHITPHGRANIPSGIRSRIEPNVALEAQNKSGIASKYGLVYGASTVDASYQGIIHINVINTTNRAIDLPLGMKIMQFLPRLIDTSEIEVCTDTSFEDFYAGFEFSNRGEGAFGSTGV